jgi:hypothetical protein
VPEEKQTWSPRSAFSWRAAWEVRSGPAPNKWANPCRQVHGSSSGFVVDESWGDRVMDGRLTTYAVAFMVDNSSLHRSPRFSCLEKSFFSSDSSGGRGCYDAAGSSAAWPCCLLQRAFSVQVAVREPGCTGPDVLK